MPYRPNVLVEAVPRVESIITVEVFVCLALSLGFLEVVGVYLNILVLSFGARFVVVHGFFVVRRPVTVPVESLILL